MLKKIIISSLEKLGILRIAHFLTRSQPRILMYHRIVDNKKLPGISVDIFEQQLIYIQKHFNVIGMDEFIQRLQNAALFSNHIVVTFDDGHKDFFQTAWPLLKKYKIPATLFVTTGFVDKKLWLWPDLLRYILLSTKSNKISVDSLNTFELTSENVLTIWNTLGDYCLTLPHQERMEFLEKLSTQLDVIIDAEPLEPFNAVSWDDLRIMHREGLNVGSHSVSHPIFSALNSLELKLELENSKNRIAEELGEQPKGICYPNGMARDTSAEVETLAQQFYQYGLVAYPAPVNKQNIMHLGRYSASNNMQHFKLVINGLSRNKNQHGEYK